jgi:GNAT superfamily N-acetyltransferase
MKTKLIRTTVDEMDDEDYFKCRSLNYRQDGDMMYALQRFRNADEEAYVYLIKCPSSDQLLAWSIVFQARQWNFSRDKWDKWWEVHFYTRKACRRRGYGRRLANAVKRDFDSHHLEVHPWSDPALDFYDGVRGFRDHYTKEVI